MLASRQLSRRALVPTVLAVQRRALGLMLGTRNRNRLNLQPLQVVRLRPSCLRVIDLLTARRQGRAMRSSVGVPRAARGGIFSGGGASAAACWLYSSHSDCGGALVCDAPCRMWAS